MCTAASADQPPQATGRTPKSTVKRRVSLLHMAWRCGTDACSRSFPSDPAEKLGESSDSDDCLHSEATDFIDHVQAALHEHYPDCVYQSRGWD